MANWRIECIILAAGESKRMGKPKLLMTLGQGTILEQTVDNFLNSEVDKVIVVVGSSAEEITKLMADRPVVVALNPAYRHGMSTSIVAGLRFVSDETQAVMLALADQPFVDAQTINRLIEAFRTHNKGIAIPVYQGRRGNPVIFAIKYKKELLSLKGDIGGRVIIKRYPGDILELPVNCAGVGVDIDTVDSYYTERSKLK